MTFRFRRALACAAILTLAACGTIVDPARVEAQRVEVPVARWDHRPDAQAWTRATMEALAGPGSALVDLVPADIDTWCPAYADAGRMERKAFWVGLLSALAKHESTWQPQVAGGGGRWIGLLQISPATARHYGCAADTAEELRDGEMNLRCAVRIIGQTVPRDGVVAANGGGVAADWGPFHQSAKRADMEAWVRAQPYCARSDA